MNILPEIKWVRVSQNELKAFLDSANYLRDLWGDADIYIQHGTGERIAAKFLDGRCYIITRTMAK